MDRMPVKHLHDTTANKNAAEQQADKIRNFWKAKGRPVNVWVELDQRSGLSEPLFIVRSDISLAGPQHERA